MKVRGIAAALWVAASAAAGSGPPAPATHEIVVLGGSVLRVSGRK